MDGPSAPERSRPATPTPRLSTRTLFPPGTTEICFDHDGVEYRLRITRSNKLILNR